MPATERSRSSEALIEIDQAAYEALPEAERRELDALLGDYYGRLDQNPLNGYFPHPKQKAFHEAKQRTRMFLGGNRSGKTTSAAADDLIQALPAELVPEHLLPYKKYGFDSPFRCRVITPDLSDTLDVVLEKFQEMCPEKALRGGAWDKAFDKVKRNLYFARGDRINFMSTEQHPNKFGGRALHRIHFDEEPAGPNSWRIYRESRQRLIDYGGDLIFSMTPLMETEWVEDKIWSQRGTDRVFGVQAAMRDNPHLSEEEIEEALADLTKEERRAVEFGEFVAFAGKYFDELNELHFIDSPSREEIKEVEDVVVSIYPGKQTGIVWVAFDRDNSATVFAELYPYDKVVEQIVPEIEQVNREWGVDDPIYVIDPNSRAKAGPMRESFESAYMRAGIFPRYGQNARGPSILEIKRRLQARPPSLYISRECEVLPWEMKKYRRDPNSSNEFDAVKKDDHLVDALRYALMERTWALPADTTSNKRSNFNPNYQPPYEAPVPPTPPLGIYS